MKEVVRQKVISNRRKAESFRIQEPCLPTSIRNKFTINNQIFARPSKILNSHQKSFNVRRINKTQQSRSHTKEISKEYSTRIPQLAQNKVDQNKKISLLPLNPRSLKLLNEKFHNLSHTLDVKRPKKKMPKIINDQIIILKKHQKSQYRQKNKFQTAEDEAEKDCNIQPEDIFYIKKQNVYPFMTKFQHDEIEKYEVLFSGQRRITSIKHFTDNEGNVKIAVGDSIAYRYEIQSILGRGSFGQVFKAFDHKNKEFVALKIIKNHPKFHRQAKIEIKILETVLLHDHNSQNNIVKMKHAFVFRGHPCLVFELLHINLYEFLRLSNYKGLCLNMIRRIAIQILQGLMFFKKFNIIHCDLKPENILFKQENRTGIKIIDVGSGTYKEEQLYTYIQSRFYRAPEVILGIRYSQKIDIWSFGCILAELYTGYPIFPGENQTEIIHMLIETIGNPPVQFINQGLRSNKFFDQNEPIIAPNNKGKLWVPGSKPFKKRFKNCQDTKFIQFLQKCFKWLPEQRFKPEQALLHNWIIQGLPQQIRQQHINLVNSQRQKSLTP